MFDINKIDEVVIINPSVVGKHKGMFRFRIKSDDFAYLNKIIGPFEPMCGVYQDMDGKFFRIFVTTDDDTISILKML